jgi:hypothetical protein
LTIFKIPKQCRKKQFIIGGFIAMDFTLWTSWKFETSEETAVTLLGTVAKGALYFKNQDNGEKMKVSYRAVSIGAGKGPPVGASWSVDSDPSGGFGNVAVVKHRYFGPLSFPFKGYILGFGASASIIPKIVGAMDQTAGGITIVLFGMFPVFAGVKLWGLSNSIVPGLGSSAGIASFQFGDW